MPATRQNSPRDRTARVQKSPLSKSAEVGQGRQKKYLQFRLVLSKNVINCDSSFQEKKALVLLLGLAFMIFFYRLGIPGLMDPDEGRYAEIAREMWQRSAWITPHLNGVKYLEKPPLVYWLTALSFAALGRTEFAARLVPALSALGGVLAVYGLGRVLFSPRAAFLAATILATAVGYVILGRLLTLDMTLTLWLTLGLGLSYLAVTRVRPSYLPWAYVSLALGILTKGPIALVLPGLIFGVWALCRRTVRVLLQLWDRRGFLILLGVTLPWFVLVSYQNPEFGRYFFLKEHLYRFLTPYSHHGQPIYYFLGILGLGMLPWSFLLPWGLACAWSTARTVSEKGDQLFCLVWAGVVVLFFSLSRAKLPPYILPALPPLALLLGQALSTRFGGRNPSPSKGLFWSLYIWLLSALGLLLVFVRPPAPLAPKLVRIAYLSPYPLGALAVLGSIPALILIGRRWPRVQWPLLLLGAVALNSLVILGMEPVASRRSTRAMARVINSSWQPGEALIGYQVYSQSLSFYTGQEMYIYGLSSELDFGAQHAPDSPLFLARPEDLVRLVQQRPRVYLILKKEALERVQQQLSEPLRIVQEWKNCLLVSNR